MTQEKLDAVKIAPRLQKVGGKGVSERMDRCRFGDACTVFDNVEHLLDRCGGDGCLGIRSGEEPIGGSVVVYIVCQLFQGYLREEGVAVPVSFSLSYSHRHAGTEELHEGGYR